MIIRQPQIHVFENAALENYVRELAEHCHEFSPLLCKTLKPEQLHAAIRYGIRQAEQHGFTQRGPVRLYIDLMIVLGSGFDTDPQYAWAAEILSENNKGEQMERAMKLHSRTETYLKAVNGTENTYSLHALAELERRLQEGLTFHHERLEEQAIRLMADIHPKKMAETGPGPFKHLIAVAKERVASSYGFQQARSLALMMTLMFAFGHRFDTDPLLPWISRTLERLDPADPEEAAVRLERRAVLWLHAVLQNAALKN